MPTNAEVLQVAINKCVPGTKPEDLRDQAYLELGAPVDEDQWDQVWQDFFDLGGRSRAQDGITRITVCARPSDSPPLVANRDVTAFSQPMDDASTEEKEAEETEADETETKEENRPWPKLEPERFAAVNTALIAHTEPASSVEIKQEFDTRTGIKRFEEILDTLVALGLAEKNGDRYLSLS